MKNETVEFIIETICIFMIAAGIMFLCSGCGVFGMSDKEYMLRKADISAKSKYASTYSPIVMEGPVTISQGGKVSVTVPNQPFQPAVIPDGQATSASLVKDVVHTGAIVGGAIYGMSKANGESTSTTTTTTTTNNVTGGVQ